MHWAALLGKEPIVRELLASAVAVSVIDKSRKSPLHYAVEKGHAGVVEELLKHGVALDVKDGSGQTARSIAEQNGNKEIVGLFDKYKPRYMDLESRFEKSLCHRDIEGAKFLIHAGTNLTNKNFRTPTPLHFAARYDSPELVALLLEKGVSATIRNQSLYSYADPFYYATMTLEQRVIEIIKLLLDRGADVNRVIYWSNLLRDICEPHYGDPDLVEKATLEVVKLLLKRGADCDRLPRWYDWTALQKVILYFRTMYGVEIARLLLKNGADVNRLVHYELSPSPSSDDSTLATADATLATALINHQGRIKAQLKDMKTALVKLLANYGLRGSALAYSVSKDHFCLSRGGCAERIRKNPFENSRIKWF